MVRRRDLESGSRRFFGFVVSFLESLELEAFLGADDSKGGGRGRAGRIRTGRITRPISVTFQPER
jgi:hypothetical protein